MAEWRVFGHSMDIFHQRLADIQGETTQHPCTVGQGFIPSFHQACEKICCH